MPKINIQKTIYRLKHRYLSLNNVVVAVAFVIAASWAWGSVEVMQRNYNLQKEVDYKRRLAKLVELEAENLEYEQRYYESVEYQALAARERLGLADPGEKVLILPPNSPSVLSSDKAGQGDVRAVDSPPSNVQQWITFLFGGNHRRLQ